MVGQLKLSARIIERTVMVLKLRAPEFQTWLSVLADGLVNKDRGWGAPVGPRFGICFWDPF